ncbi:MULTISPECIES: helix-turn-helix domain-containing protein [Stenotrophomonas]|uniref:helix-turn-helix domain-containing protein n=1 Tax=Stenotrophomonas TaxID=40323 RepID=UPI0028A81C80|nr:helix-turn-helix transcriptional regulator [Stenotrophomonas sp.]
MSEALRSLFAARLVQARQMRGLSQRALGDRMGLGKEKGSSRINRYEHQVTAVGFDSLDTLAQVLEVPPAYLLADNQEMAQTILLFSNIAPEKQASAVQLLQLLQQHPDLIEKLHALAPGLVTKP